MPTFDSISLGRPTLIFRGAALALCIVLGATSSRANSILQDQSLKSADSLVKQAVGDINAARGSAGTPGRPAKGSRLRLTKIRLSSAEQRLAAAGKLLASISTSVDGYAATKKRYDDAMAAVAEIKSIIAPGKPPAPVKPKTGGSRPPEKKPATKSAPTKRLDYRQKDQLKNARFNLRQADGFARAAAAVLARIDGEGHKPLHKEVRSALDSLRRSIEKFNDAAETMRGLPVDHPEVAAFAAEIRSKGNEIQALKSRLQAEDAKLQKITGMENYPDYKKDFELVGDFSRRYGNFELAVQQPKTLAAVIAEDAQCVKEIRRIADAYAPLVAQKTSKGKAMEKRILYALARRKGFVEKLRAYKATLPTAIEKDIAEAASLAQEGVQNKKPLYFRRNAGIDQVLGFAETKILVLKAFGDGTAAPFEKRLTELRKLIAEQAKNLEAEIIANNPLPRDAYKGADRELLVKKAIDAWKKSQPDAEVLAAKIPSEAWEREIRWRWWRDAFRKVDRSHLQIQLLVRHDDKLAVIRPINIYKNHLKGDTLTAFPFNEVGQELGPDFYLPLEKVK